MQLTSLTPLISAGTAACREPRPSVRRRLARLASRLRDAAATVLANCLLGLLSALR